MTSELKCTQYTTYDDDPENWYPCQCPVCAGFLKWKDDIPICKKCGTELIAIPEVDEGEEMEWGKICPISKRKEGA